jgi:hypothetical protein
MEELGLEREQIEVFGELDYMISPFNLIIYPFVGWLKNISTLEDIKFSKDEVAEVFTVPLDFLLHQNPEAHLLEIHPHPAKDFPFYLIQNGENYNWRKGQYPVYFYKYNDYIIWGITARILHNFLEIYRK